MDLYAILDHVVALLRQRQRVTYRALKVQFHLEDPGADAGQGADRARRGLRITGGQYAPPTV